MGILLSDYYGNVNSSQLYRSMVLLLQYLSNTMVLLLQYHITS